MNYKIMIVEDDPDIAELVSCHLGKFGFIIEKCMEFHNVLKEFEKAKPHLVLLDINLPAYDGFYWCGKIREKSSCPIHFSVFLQCRFRSGLCDDEWWRRLCDKAVFTGCAYSKGYSNSSAVLMVNMSQLLRMI